MPSFGESSNLQIRTLHPKLQRLLYAVIKYTDFSVIEGHRTKERQEQLYAEGKTKTMESRHLSYPSEAVDIAPHPYPDVNKPRDLQQVYFLIGMIKMAAYLMNLNIRVGADWNGNNDVRDDNWQDAWHIELDKSEV